MRKMVSPEDEGRKKILCNNSEQKKYSDQSELEKEIQMIAAVMSLIGKRTKAIAAKRKNPNAYLNGVETLLRVAALEARIPHRHNVWSNRAIVVSPIRKFTNFARKDTRASTGQCTY